MSPDEIEREIARDYRGAAWYWSPEQRALVSVYDGETTAQELGDAMARGPLDERQEAMAADFWVMAAQQANTTAAAAADAASVKADTEGTTQSLVAFLAADGAAGLAGDILTELQSRAEDLNWVADLAADERIAQTIARNEAVLAMHGELINRPYYEGLDNNGKRWDDYSDQIWGQASDLARNGRTVEELREIAVAKRAEDDALEDAYYDQESEEIAERAAYERAHREAQGPVSAAWRTAAAITYREHVMVDYGNDGRPEDDRHLTASEVAARAMAITTIAGATGVPEGYVFGELRAAAVAEGAAPGSDNDPDYLAPPNWETFADQYNRYETDSVALAFEGDSNTAQPLVKQMQEIHDYVSRNGYDPVDVAQVQAEIRRDYEEQADTDAWWELVEIQQQKQDDYWYGPTQTQSGAQDERHRGIDYGKDPDYLRAHADFVEDGREWQEEQRRAEFADGAADQEDAQEVADWDRLTAGAGVVLAEPVPWRSVAAGLLDELDQAWARLESGDVPAEREHEQVEYIAHLEVQAERVTTTAAVEPAGGLAAELVAELDATTDPYLGEAAVQTQLARESLTNPDSGQTATYPTMWTPEVLREAEDITNEAGPQSEEGRAAELADVDTWRAEDPTLIWGTGMTAAESRLEASWIDAARGMTAAQLRGDSVPGFTAVDSHDRMVERHDTDQQYAVHPGVNPWNTPARHDERDSAPASDDGEPPGKSGAADAVATAHTAVQADTQRAAEQLAEQEQAARAHAGDPGRVTEAAEHAPTMEAGA